VAKIEKITKEEIMKIPERYWLRVDNVKLICFCPFRDFYGGYLVYEIAGKRYKQWTGNKAARKLRVKEVNVYGKRVDRDAVSN